MSLIIKFQTIYQERSATTTDTEKEILGQRSPLINKFWNKVKSFETFKHIVSTLNSDTTTKLNINPTKVTFRTANYSEITGRSRPYNDCLFSVE